ncbi:very short patch repair endonuclease [Micromonospora sp. NBC_01739]|uniref:very short patch repair endonuclease n=1 Tax=Micromonospora sp. NBC_01739 TaxID=2975985 RepID=UPI002E1178E4|nr:very short patch repair endonuclease [Micromonospora sp. NBC_01739]
MVSQLPAPSSSGVSRRMSRQRCRDTAPELSIRKLLHARGHRYRVTWPIPGLPRRTVDVAFTRSRVAVFIDGCFWHSCPQHKTSPSANGEWWSEKLRANQLRDAATTAHLEALGWSVLRIWEHEIPADAVTRIVELLSERRAALGPKNQHPSPPSVLS